MVSWKSLFAFLAFYMSYLLLGSYMFHAFECPDEIAVKSKIATEEREFTILMAFLRKRAEELRLKVSLQNITSILNRELPELISESKTMANLTSEVVEMSIDCETWSFFNSFFMAFTSTTTIGFGTVAPKTQLGRGACLIYSIVGLPINSILIGFICNTFINQVSGK